MAKKLDFGPGEFSAIYNKAVLFWAKEDLETAMEYCDQLFVFSEEREYLRGKQYALNMKGAIHQKANEIELSLEAYFESIEIAKMRRDTGQLGIVYNNIGTL